MSSRWPRPGGSASDAPRTLDGGADRPAQPPASRAVGEHRARRGGAGDAVDTSAGVHGGSGDVEAAQRRASTEELWRGAKHEELVELVAAAEDAPADEARILTLEIRGRADGAREDEPAEAGPEDLQAALDALDDFLDGHVEALRHVRVDVERVLPRGRARVVMQRMLADHQGGLGRNAARSGVVLGAEEGLEGVADVHDAGVPGLACRPRHR